MLIFRFCLFAASLSFTIHADLCSVVQSLMLLYCHYIFHVSVALCCYYLCTNL